jgi:uroporphyrinogen decarboxylase
MSTLIKLLINKKHDCQSIWFMRQAGRYLPEFKNIRLSNKNFIKLCLDSDLSSEITLQPIKRFNLDSAIIFSDILMVPYALGQNVNFIKDEGPILSTFNLKKFLNNNKKNLSKTLSPIYKAIEITRKKLNKEKSLISFVGAPWTLLVYMLGLKENKKEINFYKIKKYNNEINLIIDNLVDYLCVHIENQVNAGANVVQVFDSWAGFIPQEELLNFCYNPNLKIVNFCKRKNIPIICFPKGIKKKYLEFNKMVRPDGINLDYDIDPLWAKENLNNVTLQGGMHPQMLLKSEEEMYKEAERYLKIFEDVPYIFNLGHGIVPETDPDKVQKLINYVRNYK